MQREKVDFLVALGEKLCHLESSAEMQKLEGLTDASGNTKTEKGHRSELSCLKKIHSPSKMYFIGGTTLRKSSSSTFLTW